MPSRNVGRLHAITTMESLADQIDTADVTVKVDARAHGQLSRATTCWMFVDLPVRDRR